jgi:hypothetical protein
VNKKTLTPQPNSKQNKAQTKKSNPTAKAKKVKLQAPTTTQRYTMKKKIDSKNHKPTTTLKLQKNYYLLIKH